VEAQREALGAVGSRQEIPPDGGPRRREELDVQGLGMKPSECSAGMPCDVAGNEVFLETTTVVLNREELQRPASAALPDHLEAVEPISVRSLVAPRLSGFEREPELSRRGERREGPAIEEVDRERLKLKRARTEPSAVEHPGTVGRNGAHI